MQMSEKIETAGSEELGLAIAEGDWLNNIALLLILALTGWTLNSDSNEDVLK